MIAQPYAESALSAYGRPAPDAPGITVVHVKEAPKDGVYVGREMRNWPASPLGNPFRPPMAIEQFKAWLKNQIRSGSTNPAVVELDRLAQLYADTGKLTLICWCAPEPCHADVIAAAVQWRLATREAVVVPDGWALFWPETAAEGLGWVVFDADGIIRHCCASLTVASTARRSDRPRVVQR